jgi:hypothetical protein
MKIDLGCGERCFGNIGIKSNLPKKENPELDKYLAKYGFIPNPNATVISQNIKDWLDAQNLAEMANNDFLLSHVIEDLENPAEVLQKIRSLNPNMLIVVVPNSHNPELYKQKSKDAGLYDFTMASLQNLLQKSFSGYYIKIVGIMKLKELFAVVSKDPMELKFQLKSNQGGKLKTVKRIGIGILDFFSKHNAMGDLSQKSKHRRPPQAITG